MTKQLKSLAWKVYFANKKNIIGGTPEYKKKNRLPAIQKFYDFAKP